MSFNELSRRELQSMCKEYGLPANRTNVAMANSLSTFLGDPRTNVLARAPHFLTPAVAKSRVKVLPKTEQQETSLAAMILASRSRDLDGQGKAVKEGRDVADGRNIKADLSGFIVTAPSKIAADCMLPKTTPLLRRRRSPKSIPPAGVDTVEIVTSPYSAQARQQSSRESQPVPDLNVAALDSCNEDSTECSSLCQPVVPEPCPGIQLEDARENTSNDLKPDASPSTRDQDYQTKRCCQMFVQPALSHVFRITADVDQLISRTTAMLEKFQAWKGDFPQGPGTDIAVGS